MLNRCLGRTPLRRTLASAADHNNKGPEFPSQYAYKLQQRLQQEGVSSIAEFWAKSKKANHVAKQPTSTGATSRSLVKPLNEIMDLNKIMTRPHTSEQIVGLWNGYHANKGQDGTGRGFLSASIPVGKFMSLVETAKQFPRFIIPLERSSPSNENIGHEFYYLEWSFYRNSTYESDGHQQTVVMFTSLQEYKLRQEFAQPYLVITHYPELINTHQIVLMRGELSGSPNRPGEFLLSQNEAQLLGIGLQKFYLAEEGQLGRKLLTTFHQNKAEFRWEDLLRV